MDVYSKEEFNKNFNISYVDDSLPKPGLALAIRHCVCSIFLYFGIYLLLMNNPFFGPRFRDEMQACFQLFILLYVLTAPFIYIVFRPKSLYTSHSINIFNYLKRIVKSIFCKNSLLKMNFKDFFETLTPSYHEKQAIMLYFIKVFFGTLMVESFLININYFSVNSGNIKSIFDGLFLSYNSFKLTMYARGGELYQYFISLLYTLDVMVFIVGYLSELACLHNKIRSVETSAPGIIFCLACYPPFNETTGSFVGWSQENLTATPDGAIGVFIWVLRIIGALFLCIYVMASFALGTKASNLTNRGTVSRFPYNIVRHPAYISKNTFWLCTTIPVIIINLGNYHTLFDAAKYVTFVLLSFIIWAGIYYIRAITEERHLMKDPEYRAYTEKVKYRFIPGVF